MKKITLAKPAKEVTSSVVLYAYTREGGGNCACKPPPPTVTNNCSCGIFCPNNH